MKKTPPCQDTPRNPMLQDSVGGGVISDGAPTGPPPNLVHADPCRPERPSVSRTT